MKNGYKKFLKHLGINPMLMQADMRSRLPDSEKPVLLKRCKEFEVCERVKSKGCKGCNVWNYLYDIKALQKKNTLAALPGQSNTTGPQATR